MPFTDPASSSSPAPPHAPGHRIDTVFTELPLRVLADAGFTAQTPQGAYYVMADVSSLGFDDDVAAAQHLVSEVGVAAVPGSSFFSRPELGSHLLRFGFPKQLATLEEAGRRLQGARGSRSRTPS